MHLPARLGGSTPEPGRSTGLAWPMGDTPAHGGAGMTGVHIHLLAFHLSCLPDRVTVIHALLRRREPLGDAGVILKPVLLDRAYCSAAVPPHECVSGIKSLLFHSQSVCADRAGEVLL